MTTSSLIATGSITDYAKKMNSDLATAFMDIGLILLCDRSGSMLARDVQGIEFGTKPKTRYEAEDELVKQLQKRHEGKILLASFDSSAVICLNGVLPQPLGETKMLAGLKKILPYTTEDVRVIVISDGQPHEPERDIISFAMTHFMGRLDTMFAGPTDSDGERFMKELARSCMGQYSTNVLNNPALLTSRVDQLLLSTGA